MDKIIPNCCPRCNSKKLYKYGKDRFGNQKYQCPICKHQFAPDSPKKVNPRKYPSCPVCGKSAFLHHDYDDYSNYRCSDKKCNHSFFQAKSTVKLPPSMSNIIGKYNFKRMRHSLHLVITALTLFYRVASLKDDISNNVIEAFNKQFKYWYKTRYGFNSFESANSMIMMFVFFFNFIRPHSSLSNLTPAQVAGLKYSKRQQNSLLLVS